MEQAVLRARLALGPRPGEPRRSPAVRTIGLRRPRRRGSRDVRQRKLLRLPVLPRCPLARG
eukprot:3549648-Alexandrium_andersonii.AAC.1